MYVTALAASSVTMVTWRKIGLVNCKGHSPMLDNNNQLSPSRWGTLYLPLHCTGAMMPLPLPACRVHTHPQHSHPMSTPEHSMLAHSACISGNLYSQLLHRWSTNPLILPHKRGTDQYQLHNKGVYAESGIAAQVELTIMEWRRSTTVNTQTTTQTEWRSTYRVGKRARGLIEKQIMEKMYMKEVVEEGTRGEEGREGERKQAQLPPLICTMAIGSMWTICPRTNHQGSGHLLIYCCAINVYLISIMAWPKCTSLP